MTSPTTNSAQPTPPRHARDAPRPEDVRAALAARPPGLGPLPVPPASDRAAWDTVDPAALGALGSRAARDLAVPWPLTRATDWARYARDGNRTVYEAAAFGRQDRLSRAAVLAAATREERWLDEVVDGVVVLCEQSSWCWPAHDDTPERPATRCHVLPDVTRPTLDLGAGEVAAQLAWVVHVLGDDLDSRAPGLTDRVRLEVERRVLGPLVERTDWHWLGTARRAHNWTAWIAGNAIVAALVLGGDRRDDALAVALAALGRFLAVLPDDGAIDEGWSYWWQGACRALEALEIVHHATGGQLDGFGLPGVRATLEFPARMRLGDDWFVSVADARPRPSGEEAWPALHRLGRRLGSSDAEALAARYRPGTGWAAARPGLGRLLAALTDPGWRDAARPAGDGPLPRDAWLGSVQVGVSRERAGSARGLTLTVKGGHNDEPHNHDDVGSVGVAVDGVPVLVDAGRPTYTAATFGPERYTIWSMTSSWHGVPEVRGTPQGHGPAFRARDVRRAEPATDATDGADASTTALDLAAAYPRADLHRWERRATLHRTGRPRVVVEDRWDAEPDPDAAPTRVHWLVAGDVDLTRPGRAVVHPRDGARDTLLTWEPAVPATLTGRPLDDPLLAAAWGPALARLELTVDDRRGSGRLTTTVEVDG